MEGIGIEKARQTLGEIVNRAQYKDELTVITRAGKPAAVVISVDMAKTMWGMAVSTLNGAAYAHLLRELREIAPGADSDRSGAPQLTDEGGTTALCLLNRFSGYFRWK